MEMLQRKSSIETEPMTLYLDQIKNAREEAMCVIKTKTFQEAMDIFTKETQESLRACEEKRERCLGMKDDDDDDDDDGGDDNDEEDERLVFLSPHGWDIADQLLFNNETFFCFISLSIFVHLFDCSCRYLNTGDV
uniref:Uncharacterized protein n=3 Tax=Noccaea caerulescens TaxID=107243 RepID=A0A1J3H893_NOCCA